MMAEFLGISYFRIIGYALLPCLLYYTGVFSGVHFRTVRMGIDKLPPEEIPKWRDILTLERIAGLLVPTGVLLYLIAVGQPLQLAGFYACVSALAVFLLVGIMKRKIRETMKLILSALSEGGRDVAQIVPILVSVSMLVNLIGLTGIAPKISGVILQVGGTNLYFSLLIATVVPFLLGTSLPVVPPTCSPYPSWCPLLKLGIDPVAAHLFFIYWAILGGVTPPRARRRGGGGNRKGKLGQDRLFRHEARSGGLHPALLLRPQPGTCRESFLDEHPGPRNNRVYRGHFHSLRHVQPQGVPAEPPPVRRLHRRGPAPPLPGDGAFAHRARRGGNGVRHRQEDPVGQDRNQAGTPSEALRGGGPEMKKSTMLKNMILERKALERPRGI
jgi:hypothetical protein